MIFCFRVAYRDAAIKGIKRADSIIGKKIANSIHCRRSIS